MIVTMSIITGSFSTPAFAQADEFEPPPTGASTPNASVMPTPANPRTWCEEGGYCDGNTPPPATTERTPPPPPRVDRPHACIGGDLVSFEEHEALRREAGLDAPIRPRNYSRLRMQADNVDMRNGVTADLGFGGICHCPTGYELMPVASGFDANRQVEAQVNRRIDRQNSMQCVPNVGDTQLAPPPVDFGPLLVRIEMDERTLWLHMCQSNGVSFDRWFAADYEERNALCPVIDQIGDTDVYVWNRDCAGRENAPTFEVWMAATPAQRVVLCPNVNAPTTIVNNNGVSLEVAADVGIALHNTGIEAQSVEGNAAFQLTMVPSSTARVLPTVRIDFGGGRMNDGGGVEIRNPVRLNVGMGVQVLLTQRLRLDALVTTGAIWSSNTNANQNGDGIRGSRAVGGELALSIDLGRAQSASNLMPYLRLSGGVQSIRYNLVDDAANSHYVRATDARVGLSFGIRFGRRR